MVLPALLSPPSLSKRFQQPGLPLSSRATNTTINHSGLSWELGFLKKQRSERNEGDFIPKGVTWIRDAVLSFEPDSNRLHTRDGNQFTYDWLIVAPGIQINWGKIPGLKESLGRNQVCSNYSYQHVD